jgi:CRISPR-associated protein Cas2
MFDLPVDTKRARKAYATFRKDLLTDGFTKLQYSVYARSCASEENACVHSTRIEQRLPSGGEVRILTLTDKQFGRMKTYVEKRPAGPPKPLRQLELF